MGAFDTLAGDGHSSRHIIHQFWFTMFCLSQIDDLLDDSHASRWLGSATTEGNIRQ
jgi:hypothetical protein